MNTGENWATSMQANFIAGYYLIFIHFCLTQEKTAVSILLALDFWFYDTCLGLYCVIWNCGSVKL